MYDIKPKRLRTDDPGYARFLTFGCYRHLPLFQIPFLCETFLRELDTLRNEFDLELWAYVIMPDHVHFLVFPTRDVDFRKELGKLKRRFSHFALGWLKEHDQLTYAKLQVIRKGEITYRFWQHGGGHDRNLWTPDRIRLALDYIHNNPVKAGLVTLPEEYKWSSAKAWATGAPDPIAINADSLRL